MTGKGARFVTAGSKLGAACIKLHAGLGQSQIERDSGTTEMRLQRNFAVTVPQSHISAVCHFCSVTAIHDFVEMLLPLCVVMVGSAFLHCASSTVEPCRSFCIAPVLR